eukprot:CAMPEP_0174988054 /NCGR_PEP_ID=MMETSP0004_2-20121128/19901_1 /TAXON_ID=420556 /ORGANISM="Ochromonas sp., Strain CCMP1393" /LENGTH=912 /DNA_ID=CAMNT_0016241205 /DNA_START=107 /DNA_END=2842 /DNA_ORIENTATION=+
MQSFLSDSLPPQSVLENVGSDGHFWLNVNVASKKETWSFRGPIGFDSNKVLCIHRWKIWWSIPRLLKNRTVDAGCCYGGTESWAPPETYLLIGKLAATGDYLVLLPVIDEHTSFSLEGLSRAAAAADGGGPGGKGGMDNLTGKSQQGEEKEDQQQLQRSDPEQQERVLVIHGHENTPSDFERVSTTSTSRNSGTSSSATGTCSRSSHSGSSNSGVSKGVNTAATSDSLHQQGLHQVSACSTTTTRRALLISTGPHLFPLLRAAFRLAKEHLQTQLGAHPHNPLPPRTPSQPPTPVPISMPLPEPSSEPSSSSSSSSSSSETPHHPPPHGTVTTPSTSDGELPPAPPSLPTSTGGIPPPACHGDDDVNATSSSNRINSNSISNSISNSNSRDSYLRRISRFHMKRGIGPHFIDHFGWCSWDSFYTDLSGPQLLCGLSSFASTSIRPRFMILDDGWQHTTVNEVVNGRQWGGRLTSFQANFKFSSAYTRHSDGPTGTAAGRSSRNSAGVVSSPLAGINAPITAAGGGAIAAPSGEEDLEADAASIAVATTTVTTIVVETQQPVTAAATAATSSREQEQQQQLEHKHKQQQHEEEAARAAERGLLGGLDGTDLAAEHSLEEVIRAAKGQFGIKQLLVWHTLSGYWAGVAVEEEEEAAAAGGEGGESRIAGGKDGDAPNASAAAAAPVDPTCNTVRRQNSRLNEFSPQLAFPDISPSMHRMAVSGDLPREPFSTQGVGLVPNHHAGSFFDRYHATLAAMGVDGVKVDAQSILPSLRSDTYSGWEIASVFQQPCSTPQANTSPNTTNNYNNNYDHDHDNPSIRYSGGSSDGVSIAAGSSLQQQQLSILHPSNVPFYPASDHHSEFPIIHCMCHSQGTLLSMLAIYPSHDVLSAIPILPLDATAASPAPAAAAAAAPA